MIGLAYGAFYESFKQYIPSLTVINKDQVKDCSLIIFSGGEDISPAIYGESNTYTSGVNTRRDNIEIEILKEAMRLNKKIFGVCRGHQLINAVLGGRLIQDIFIELNDRHPGNHSLRTADGSTVKKFFSTVNSMHHQAVSSAGKGLVATSFYLGEKSQVIESCESKNILTVQFHPEFMGEESMEFFNFLTTEWLKSTAEVKGIQENSPMEANGYFTFEGDILVFTQTN